ncbi:MAG: TonB-dependent receptor [Bacteroidota bacterium]
MFTLRPSLQKIWLSGLLICAATFQLSAQTVNGVVLDKTKEPILGAYVNLTGTQVHTHTDEFGKFAITGVGSGDTLNISLLGFEPQKIVVADLDDVYRVVLEEASFDLGQVVVSQNNKELNVVASIDVELAPVRTSQELLRRVPGLFIGQHAGGGKAEQIFLRGFDIDHGTDISISVDGMPVNMVSHAHGQGYADMHFIIPETLDKIDFGKGPYYAEQGNFNTAGYVDFTTKRRLENSQIGLDIGQFNTIRALGMISLLDTFNQSAYIATEYSVTDGPFESPQNFYRTNIMGKYSARLPNGTSISLLASHFDSEWDASGQVPQRAVDSGLITRFGAIDDTEGGSTSRTNFALNATHPLPDGSFLRSNAYLSNYDFELFSNFTFFLEDPDNADQIRQQEERTIFGVETSWNKSVFIGGNETLLKIGGGFRADDVNNIGLSRTANRRTLLESIQQGEVVEKNYYGFASAALEVGNWLFQPALRYDYFEFNYVDALATQYDNQSQSASILAPKMSVVYDAAQNIQLFAKAGFGFHSNDTRVVLQESRDILPAAFGVDVGALFKPGKRIIANVALWHLYLEQEFVYVGDAGIVEPSGETRRQGIDLGIRYQIADWLYANADGTYTYARSLGDPEGENLIPLAPIYTAVGGLTVQKDKFTSRLEVRYLGDRPANEDDSIVAEGYTVVDWSANYDFGRVNLGFQIENLFDVDWNETQFATESRLRDEPTSFEEIHFTPGFPFFFKSTLRYNF